MGQNIVSLRALLAKDGISLNEQADIDARRLLESADVILAIDAVSRHEFLMFGPPASESTSVTGTAASLAVLFVEIDQDTDELERLAALVLAIKGRCDYQGKTVEG